MSRIMRGFCVGESFGLAFAFAFVESRFRGGLLALPLPGAGVTFFAAAKKATVLRVKRWGAKNQGFGGFQAVPSRIMALSCV
ncbi:hypothetical protein, partial [Caballeronia sp. EK]|uniref:hypothetical protein n=1 Tax=Caballeronia sp. EK TaxID=2767469 RepID=UPI001CA38CB9